MKIYLIRHGETDWNKEEIFRGRTDVPLNEIGKAQARMVGLSLREKRIDRILTSPLLRAKETAEIIGKYVNVPVLIKDELIDMDFGSWEGTSLEEVKKRFKKEFEIWKNSPQKWRFDKAESLKDVRRRIKRLIDGIEDEEIVIVTHRVVCKILSLFLLRMPNRYFWAIKFDPASISIFEYENDRYVATLINDTSHLRNISSIYIDF